jgi:type IV pilus assembly protein PilB
MGVEPCFIASTVKAVVGQRLVRRLRPETRSSYQPTEEEKQMIIKMFRLRPGQDFRYIHELEKQAAAEGVGGDTPLSTDENGIKTLWRSNPDDDADGAQDGYKGRIGIYEVLNNTVDIQKLIVARATSTQLQDQAITDGMVTIQTDGLIKALRGETTVEEVLRVSKE